MDCKTTRCIPAPTLYDHRSVHNLRWRADPRLFAGSGAQPRSGAGPRGNLNAFMRLSGRAGANVVVGSKRMPRVAPGSIFGETSNVSGEVR